MKEPIVVDSTCLIGLERIGALDILPALFDPIFIAPEVEREFGVTLPWLTVEAPADKALMAALRLLVDDGEAATIALASEQRLRIILDDWQAREVAKRLSLAVIGTVGCLLRAKQAGVITAVMPLIEPRRGRLLPERGFKSGSAEFGGRVTRPNYRLNPTASQRATCLQRLGAAS